MTSLVFDGTDSNGNYHECHFSDSSLTRNLDAVNGLFLSGWTIYRIRLLDNAKSTVLPSAILNQEAQLNPLDQLLHEVHSILSATYP